MSDLNKTELKKVLKDKDLKDFIFQIVKDAMMKDKELEDKNKEITKDTLDQLFKTMWQKRDFWRNNIK